MKKGEDEGLRKEPCEEPSRDPLRFEIQLGHLCNNRCVFCSSGELSERREAKEVPLGAVIDAFEEARAAGAARITFLGGEPTLHKGLVPAIRHAVRIGFSEIVIFTNGTMISRPGFVAQISALGSFEWRVSIQGGTKSAHEAVTRRKGSFDRLIDGLRILHEHGQRITVNLCATEKNYRSLPELPELISRFGIRELHVDLVRPHSVGECGKEDLLSIMLRYSAMAPYLERMLARLEAISPEVDFGIGNLPYCILPKWSHRVRHGGRRTVTRASDRSGLEEAVEKYDWHKTLRCYPSGCDKCPMRDLCQGVFTEYLALHGEDEFAPSVFERGEAP